MSLILPSFTLNWRFTASTLFLLRSFDWRTPPRLKKLCMLSRRKCIAFHLSPLGAYRRAHAWARELVLVRGLWVCWGCISRAKNGRGCFAPSDACPGGQTQSLPSDSEPTFMRGTGITAAGWRASLSGVLLAPWCNLKYSFGSGAGVARYEPNGRSCCWRKLLNYRNRDGKNNLRKYTRA